MLQPALDGLATIELEESQSSRNYPALVNARPSLEEIRSSYRVDPLPVEKSLEPPSLLPPIDEESVKTIMKVVSAMKQADQRLQGSGSRRRGAPAADRYDEETQDNIFISNQIQNSMKYDPIASWRRRGRRHELT